MSKIHTCEICNKEYVKPKSLSPSRFCSRKCWYEYQRSDTAREISREKMLKTREKYEAKHGEKLGFKSTNNPSQSLERRKKLSELRKGAITPKSIRQKISISLKETLKDPKLREKRSKFATGRKPDLSIRKKISASHRAKTGTRKGIIDSLDRVYSRYIREKEAINGRAACITCDRVSDIDNMDCGHYISRRFMSLRYDERNTHCQCVSCNRFQQGNIDVYTIKIIGLYGPEILTEFNTIRNSSEKISIPELRAKLDYYREKLSELNPDKFPLWA